MNFKTLTASLLLASVAGTASAQEWIDTSSADNLISFGARLGFNTANATRSSKGALCNLDSWGTGFDAGFVVNLNFMECLALQPGFFFESRSHNYSYVRPSGSDLIQYNIHEYGHTRNTAFHVPVMVVFSIDPMENLRWSFEMGPSFNFGLGGSDKGTMEIGTEIKKYNDGYYDGRHKFDFSIKMGTGVQLFDSYYLGIHYDAGCSKVWKDGKSGRNKAWTFTIGYNF